MKPQLKIFLAIVFVILLMALMAFIGSLSPMIYFVLCFVGFCFGIIFNFFILKDDIPAEYHVTYSGIKKDEVLFLAKAMTIDNSLKSSFGHLPLLLDKKNDILSDPVAVFYKKDLSSFLILYISPTYFIDDALHLFVSKPYKVGDPFIFGRLFSKTLSSQNAPPRAYKKILGHAIMRHRTATYALLYSEDKPPQWAFDLLGRMRQKANDELKPTIIITLKP